MEERRRCVLCDYGQPHGKPPHILVRGRRKKLIEDEDDNRILPFSMSVYPNAGRDGFQVSEDWLGPLLGPLNSRLLPSSSRPIFIHRLCTSWCPQVYESERAGPVPVSGWRNVGLEIKRAKSLTCSRCHRVGAALGCRHKSCPKNYHLSCARAECARFDHEQFLIACKDHIQKYYPGRDNGEDDSYNPEEGYLDDSDDGCNEDFFSPIKAFENARATRHLPPTIRITSTYPECMPHSIGGNKKDESELAWEHVVLLNHLKEGLIEHSNLVLRYAYPCKGVLLHGPSGVGKSLVAKSLVQHYGKGVYKVSYFSIKGHEAAEKYAGKELDTLLQDLFRNAKVVQPSFILIEDVHALCRKTSSMAEIMMNMMMSLDNKDRVFVLATTSCPSKLGTRLGKTKLLSFVYIDIPKSQGRREILQVITKCWKTPPSEITISNIVKYTPNYSGEDLQILADQALRNAKEGAYMTSLDRVEVSDDDWKKAICMVGSPYKRRTLKTCAFETLDIEKEPLDLSLFSLVYKRATVLVLSFYRMKVPFLYYPLIRVARYIAKKVEGKPLSARLSSTTLEKIKAKLTLVDFKEENDQPLMRAEALGDKPLPLSTSILLSGNMAATQCLARYVLHCFQRHIQIKKINRHTLKLHGEGKVIQGIEKIIGDCEDLEACIFYMPEMDEWVDQKTWIHFQSFLDYAWSGYHFIILATIKTPMVLDIPEVRIFFGMEKESVESHLVHLRGEVFYFPLCGEDSQWVEDSFDVVLHEKSYDTQTVSSIRKRALATCRIL